MPTPDQAGARLVEVAVDAPLKYPLTYVLPEAMAAAAVPGQRVLVPLGRRQVTGYILSFPEAAEAGLSSLKTVIKILDPEPLLSESMLKLLRWSAGYYFSALSDALRVGLPPGVNVSSRRLIRLSEAGRKSLDPDQDPAADRELLGALAAHGQLTPGQLAAKLGAKVPESRLSRLQAAGLIEVEQALADPRVKERTERAVALIREPTAGDLAGINRRAKERARFLLELKGRGQVTLKELKGSFKDPARLARALVDDGWAAFALAPAGRDPFSMDLPLDPPPQTLMAGQESALAAVVAALDAREFKVFLIEGVTGSGKTEVYLRAIERVRETGGTALMLVPEIALTPQLTARFRQRFPDSELAVLHSGLGDGERFDEWRRIRSGRARIVIGARSAVFAPLSGLRLIVVDEEHEGAYKQDHGLMYHGRDLAVMRGREEGAVVVLGSATPSLESSHRARQDQGYSLLKLPCRVVERPLPTVEIVDLREQAVSDEPGGPEQRVREMDRLDVRSLFTAPLRQALAETLDRGEQSILFLNRRGIFSFLVCFDCGARQTCPNCDVALAHHRAPTRAKVDEFYGTPEPGGYLLCHYCGYHAPLPEVCPSCRGVRLRPFGAGTEQVEEAVNALFPQARTMRIDSDVMGGRDSYFRMLDRAYRREADVLVGTQIIAKGHDLPGVTLVGVLLADVSLNQPDFRASERTYQVLTQVAGRAGRGDAPGRVIIQTFNPDHYAIRLAVAQDYDAFYQEESERRQALAYPPFARLANFRLSGPNPEAVKQAARVLGQVARRRANTKAFSGQVRLLGPAAAPIPRLRGKSRWMLLVKADTPAVMGQFLRSVLAGTAGKELPPSVRLEIDRDPVSLM